MVKARKASAHAAASSSTLLQKPTGTDALPLWTCPECGGAVTNPRHVRCEACIGADPAQAPEIRGRRGAAIAARKRAQSEWDKANPGVVYDPDQFRRDSLPALQNVKLTEIAAAAGCSKGVRERHQAGEVGAARLDMASAGRVRPGRSRVRPGRSRIRPGRFRMIFFDPCHPERASAASYR
jgi:hypothetical protein